MDPNKRNTRSSALTTDLPVQLTQDQVQGKGTGHSDSTDSFQAFVVNSLNALNSLPNRVAEIQTATTQILEENAEMKKSIEYSSEQIAALTTTVKDQATKIQKLATELAHESKQGDMLAKRLQVQNQQILQQEVYSRKSNIIIEGMEESENESLDRKYVECLNDKFAIKTNKADIDKIHRFGRSIGGKPRPIIVKYVTHRARDEVLYAARNLKNKPPHLYINEDLPAEIKSQRAVIRAVSIQARAAGARTVKLQGDRVIIDNRTYTYETINSVPDIYSLESARTVKVSQDTTSFYSRFSYLSNFYQAYFWNDGIQYNSVEQMYQRRKLEAAGRDDLIPQLMCETNCIKMKRIGDGATLPRDSAWHQSKENVMRVALQAKFDQNPSLMQKLKSTGKQTLVEATRDLYWGAGVALSSDMLKNNTWAGQNKLGQLLMHIRDN